MTHFGIQYMKVAQVAVRHIICIFLCKCEDICGTVRNVQFSGFTPEPKLSVAVSFGARAACFMKHGDTLHIILQCSDR